MPSFASNSINFDNVQVNGDIATVTLTIPYASISLLKDLLESLSSFTSYLQLKARHKKSLVTINNSEFKEEQDNNYQVLSKAVHLIFNNHYNGSNFREAVGLTKTDLVSKGHSITCGIIEIILRNERKK